MKRVKNLAELRIIIEEELISNNQAYKSCTGEDNKAYWLGRFKECELLMDFIDGPDGRT